MRVLRVLSALVALVLLGGCGAAVPWAAEQVQPTPVPVRPSTPAQVREVVQRGVAAPPYSAVVRSTTTLGDDPENTLVMSGTLNLNGETLTGTVEVIDRTADDPAHTDVLLTGRSAWVRAGGGDWTQADREQLNLDSGFASYPLYAQALLAGGDSVVKGRGKTPEGVPAVRLSGRITAAQAGKIEPRVATALREADLDGFGCDIWVDDEGRVVRMVQTLTTGAFGVKSVVTLSGFGPPVEVAAPEVVTEDA